MSSKQYPAEYRHVRAMTVCANCGNGKGQGLLVCWPCHRSQKRMHDGMYSRKLTDRLELLERAALHRVRS